MSAVTGQMRRWSTKKVGPPLYPASITLTRHSNCKFSRLADVNVVISAVLSGQLTWLPNGSEMPEETNCRFAASQEAALSGEEPYSLHLACSIRGHAPLRVLLCTIAEAVDCAGGVAICLQKTLNPVIL